LRTLLTTIFANRCAVILACGCWIFLINDQNVGVGKQATYPKTNPEQDSPREGFAGTLTSMPVLTKNLLFALAVFLGILEKLSGVANMISMERDWIPILAPHSSGSTSSAYDLTHLNAVIRRIDLICKLIAPVWISVIISASKSIRLGVLVVAGMSVLSWPADYMCARRVYNANPRLNQSKSVGDNLNVGLLPSDTSVGSSEILQWPRHLLHGMVYGLRQHASSIQQYFASDVWMPSLSLAMLHLSVLSYSATFLTYLLDTGFSLILITVVRALSSVVEVSSTIVTPWGVQYLSKQRHHPEHGDAHNAHEEAEERLLDNDGQRERNIENGAGLERLGLWGIWWQFLNTVSQPPPNSKNVVSIY